MKRFKIRGQSPDAVDHFWSGTGWTDATDRTYDEQEANTIMRDVIAVDNGWIAWMEPIGG